MMSRSKPAPKLKREKSNWKLRKLFPALRLEFYESDTSSNSDSSGDDEPQTEMQRKMASQVEERVRKSMFSQSSRTSTGEARAAPTGSASAFSAAVSRQMSIRRRSMEMEGVVNTTTSTAAPPNEQGSGKDANQVGNIRGSSKEGRPGANPSMKMSRRMSSGGLGDGRRGSTQRLAAMLEKVQEAKKEGSSLLTAEAELDQGSDFKTIIGKLHKQKEFSEYEDIFAAKKPKEEDDIPVRKSMTMNASRSWSMHSFGRKRHGGQGFESASLSVGGSQKFGRRKSSDGLGSLDGLSNSRDEPVISRASSNSRGEMITSPPVDENIESSGSTDNILRQLQPRKSNDPDVPKIGGEYEKELIRRNSEATGLGSGGRESQRASRRGSFPRARAPIERRDSEIRTHNVKMRRVANSLNTHSKRQKAFEKEVELHTRWETAKLWTKKYEEKTRTKAVFNYGNKFLGTGGKINFFEPKHIARVKAEKMKKAQETGEYSPLFKALSRRSLGNIETAKDPFRDEESSEASDDYQLTHQQWKHKLRLTAPRYLQYLDEREEDATVQAKKKKVTQIIAQRVKRETIPPFAVGTKNLDFCRSLMALRYPPRWVIYPADYAIASLYQTTEEIEEILVAALLREKVKVEKKALNSTKRLYQLLHQRRQAQRLEPDPKIFPHLARKAWVPRYPNLHVKHDDISSGDITPVKDPTVSSGLIAALMSSRLSCASASLALAAICPSSPGGNGGGIPPTPPNSVPPGFGSPGEADAAGLNGTGTPGGSNGISSSPGGAEAPPEPERKKSILVTKDATRVVAQAASLIGEEAPVRKKSVLVVTKKTEQIETLVKRRMSELLDFNAKVKSVLDEAEAVMETKRARAGFKRAGTDGFDRLPMFGDDALGQLLDGGNGNGNNGSGSKGLGASGNGNGSKNGGKDRKEVLDLIQQFDAKVQRGLAHHEEQDELLKTRHSIAQEAGEELFGIVTAKQKKDPGMRGSRSAPIAGKRSKDVVAEEEAGGNDTSSGNYSRTVSTVLDQINFGENAPLPDRAITFGTNEGSIAKAANRALAEAAAARSGGTQPAKPAGSTDVLETTIELPITNSNSGIAAPNSGKRGLTSMAILIGDITNDQSVHGVEKEGQHEHEAMSAQNEGISSQNSTENLLKEQKPLTEKKENFIELHDAKLLESIDDEGANRLKVDNIPGNTDDRPVMRKSQIEESLPRDIDDPPSIDLSPTASAKDEWGDVDEPVAVFEVTLAAGEAVKSPGNTHDLHAMRDLQLEESLPRDIDDPPNIDLSTPASAKDAWGDDELVADLEKTPAADETDNSTGNADDRAVIRKSQLEESLPRDIDDPPNVDLSPPASAQDEWGDDEPAADFDKTLAVDEVDNSPGKADDRAVIRKSQLEESLPRDIDDPPNVDRSPPASARDEWEDEPIVGFEQILGGDGGVTTDWDDSRAQNDESRANEPVKDDVSKRPSVNAEETKHCDEGTKQLHELTKQVDEEPNQVDEVTEFMEASVKEERKTPSQATEGKRDPDQATEFTEDKSAADEVTEFSEIPDEQKPVEEMSAVAKENEPSEPTQESEVIEEKIENVVDEKVVDKVGNVGDKQHKTEDSVIVVKPVDPVFITEGEIVEEIHETVEKNNEAKQEPAEFVDEKIVAPIDIKGTDREPQKADTVEEETEIVEEIKEEVVEKTTEEVQQQAIENKTKPVKAEETSKDKNVAPVWQEEKQEEKREEKSDPEEKPGDKAGEKEEANPEEDDSDDNEDEEGYGELRAFDQPPAEEEPQAPAGGPPQRRTSILKRSDQSRRQSERRPTATFNRERLSQVVFIPTKESVAQMLLSGKQASELFLQGASRGSKGEIDGSGRSISSIPEAEDLPESLARQSNQAHDPRRTAWNFTSPSLNAEQPPEVDDDGVLTAKSPTAAAAATAGPGAGAIDDIHDELKAKPPGENNKDAGKTSGNVTPTEIDDFSKKAGGLFQLAQTHLQKQQREVMNAHLGPPPPKSVQNFDFKYPVSRRVYPKNKADWVHPKDRVKQCVVENRVNYAYFISSTSKFEVSQLRCPSSIEHVLGRYRDTKRTTARGTKRIAGRETLELVPGTKPSLDSQLSALTAGETVGAQKLGKTISYQKKGSAVEFSFSANKRPKGMDGVSLTDGVCVRREGYQRYGVCPRPAMTWHEEESEYLNQEANSYLFCDQIPTNTPKFRHLNFFSDTIFRNSVSAYRKPSMLERKALRHYSKQIYDLKPQRAHPVPPELLKHFKNKDGVQYIGTNIIRPLSAEAAAGNMRGSLGLGPHAAKNMSGSVAAHESMPIKRNSIHKSDTELLRTFSRSNALAEVSKLSRRYSERMQFPSDSSEKGQLERLYISTGMLDTAYGDPMSMGKNISMAKAPTDGGRTAGGGRRSSRVSRQMQRLIYQRSRAARHSVRAKHQVMFVFVTKRGNFVKQEYLLDEDHKLQRIIGLDIRSTQGRVAANRGRVTKLRKDMYRHMHMELQVMMLQEKRFAEANDTEITYEEELYEYRKFMIESKKALFPQNIEMQKELDSAIPLSKKNQSAVWIVNELGGSKSAFQAAYEGVRPGGSAEGRTGADPTGSQSVGLASSWAPPERTTCYALGKLAAGLFGSSDGPGGGFFGIADGAAAGETKITPVAPTGSPPSHGGSPNKPKTLMPSQTGFFGGGKGARVLHSAYKSADNLMGRDSGYSPANSKSITVGSLGENRRRRESQLVPTKYTRPGTQLIFDVDMARFNARDGAVSTSQKKDIIDRPGGTPLVTKQCIDLATLNDYNRKVLTETGVTGWITNEGLQEVRKEVRHEDIEVSEKPGDRFLYIGTATRPGLMATLALKKWKEERTPKTTIARMPTATAQVLAAATVALPSAIAPDGVTNGSATNGAATNVRPNFNANVMKFTNHGAYIMPKKGLNDVKKKPKPGTEKTRASVKKVKKREYHAIRSHFTMAGVVIEDDGEDYDINLNASSGSPRSKISLQFAENVPIIQSTQMNTKHHLPHMLLSRLSM